MPYQIYQLFLESYYKNKDGGKKSLSGKQTVVIGNNKHDWSSYFELFTSWL